MMNKSNFKQKTKLRILALIPVGLCLFAGIAFVNGQTKSNIEPRKQEVNNKPFTVVIDPGHGGQQDPGAKSSNGILEKDINLAIAKLLKTKSTSDLKIICTRETDDRISLPDRVQKVNKEKYDLLIVLHLNASKDPKQNGFECMVAENDNPENFKAAKILIDEFSQIKDFTVNQKIAKCSYYIGKNAKGKNVFSPVLHLNIVSITNDHDAEFISKKENQELVCDKIINAINRFRNE